MMRQATKYLFLSWAALAVTSGCGRADRSTGSNTNWLTRCDSDADCGGGQCWCHACTAPCTATSECGSASCRETTELGCGEPSGSPTVCVVECATAADCRDRGPDIECLNGACLPAPTPGGGGAGGDDTGAGGASAGTGNPGGTSGAPSAGAGGSGLSGTSGAGGSAGGSGSTAVGGASGQAGSAPVALVDPRNGRIALAAYNACVQSGGNVYCWGVNDQGQLGFPPVGTGPKPIVKIAGLSGISGVAIAKSYACAFTEGGDVYCWGDNGSGQVGSESAPAGTCNLQGFEYSCQPTPTLVPGVEHVVELALDDEVACALIDDGSVRCWGKTADLDPWISTIASATSISVGPQGACATVTGGELSCSFELPPPAQSWATIRRLKLARGSDESFVSQFGCALDADGGVSCFGSDSLGQLGDGDGESTASSAVVGGVVQLAAGDAHACALLADGQLECWGENWYGAVGGYRLASPNCQRSWNFTTAWDPSATCESAPRIVEGVPPLVAIGASDQRTCGFSADETLWCWGNLAYAYGAPVRVVGPWEAGGEACSSLLEGVVASNSFTTSPCTTDDDCTALPLDLPCVHTCDVAPIAKNQVQYLQPVLDTYRNETCPAAADAGCPSPSPVSCPERSLRSVCAYGVCAFDDPLRTGCTDQCACTLERSWTTLDTVCDGFHLMLLGVVTCGQCDGSWVYLTVGNRGALAFDGDATLSFHQRDDGAPLVPPDRTLTLHLGPGEVSAPIRVDSQSKGYIDVLIAAAGDCYEDEAYPSVITWEFPSPSNPCD